MAGAGAARDGPIRGRPRRLDRQRRPADDRQLARDRPGEPLLGGQRLRAHLRRLPAARWTPRRPARSKACVHGRSDPLRPRLARRRLRPVRRRADRRPGGPGPRRGDPLAGRALDRHHDLSRRRRAQQGARRLGSGRGCRRCRRRPARRRAHRVPRLGVGALGQRPDRDRRRAPGSALDRREPLGVRDSLLRRRRGDQRHGRALGAGLRAGRGARRGLGLGADDRSARRGGRSARRLRRDRAAVQRSRWCRSRSSACEP